MAVLLVKIMLLAVMAAAALLFGLLPLKIYKYIEKQRATQSAEKRATRLLSMLSCLSGGVFLGVCLLDLLPMANEAFDEVKLRYGWKSDFPYTELLIGIGFFLVYLMEVLSNHICGHSHASYDEKQSECRHCKNEDDMIEQWSGSGQVKENGDQIKKEQLDKAVLAPAITDSEKDNYFKSLTLVIAFALHSCLEGFAFGVQYTMFSVTTLFLGIIVHKSVVAFSIGMNLIRNHPGKIYFVISLVVFVALTAPIGGLIGIALESVEIGEQSRNIVTAAITSLANGTFIYVTFFEILYVEQGKEEQSGLGQWLSTLAGFAIIALLMLFDS